MPEYLAPGVFVEEIDSGSKPIEGVGVNTAAFIGYAKSGDFNKPTFITNWSQFCQLFGEEENALMRGLCQELGMTVSQVRAAQKASRKGWTEFANAAILRAIQEKKAAVKSWPEFLKKYNISQTGQPYMEGSYLAHAVRGYYDNGGSRAYIIRVARAEDLEALAFSADGGAKKALPATPAQVTAGPLAIRAAKAGAGGNGIKVEVEPVGDGNEFRLKVSQGSTNETFGDPKDKDKGLTLENVASVVNGKSKLIEVEVVTKTASRPDALEYLLAGGQDAVAASSAPTETPLSNGLASLRPDDFIGDEAQRTGVGGLVPIVDVNFICAPDLMAGVWKRADVSSALGNGALGPEELNLTDQRRQAILDAQCLLVAHCERMGSCMAILDPLPGLSPQEMNDVTMNTPYNSDHGQAAIYYPWIKISDPLNRGQQMLCPPCGHVAGVWTRVGVERGVHKAPANEVLLGAVDLEVDVTKGEQELLNPNGINCIRAFPGRGIRIWGARTLATVGNPSWKYVNVRRLFNYLEQSLERNLQWVVFEPNDDDLWSRVRRNISAFLWTEWKEGKLFGVVPEEAFYVKCDRETNPPEMVDLGRLYVEIGVNPVKPAEFVIIRIGQWSGGSSLAEQ
ncbi:MAG TPA: phage tail sheath subtilisin-like domain-containing protein [Chthonomonadaceae bacterium]|nr:phage tail sheath subtilisin-like domain-containing protein [Chthonomonadaceae bacterium]